MPSTDSHALLVGCDRRRTRRWLGVAGALFVLYLVGLLAFGLWEPDRLWRMFDGHVLLLAAFWGALAALALTAGAVAAYRNDGWAVSVALALVPAAALGLFPLAKLWLVLPSFTGIHRLIPGLPGLVAMALFGGSLAFAVGSGARRLGDDGSGGGRDDGSGRGRGERTHGAE